MDNYQDLFENRTSKIFFLMYSTLLTFAFTPLIYAIIWYERNNHHRTLINQGPMLYYFLRS